jgi:hypothetical protein
VTRLAAWWRNLRAALPRIRKTTAAVWSTLTPPALVGVLALLGFHVDAATAAAILGVGAAVLAPAAVYRAKANETGPDAEAPSDPV